MDSTSYNQAIQAFSEFTTRFPNSAAIPKALYYIGKSSFRLGNLTTARIILQEVIEKYPNNSYAANAQRMLGYVYFRQKDYENALTAFELYVKLYPTSPYQEDVIRRIAGIKHVLMQHVDALKTLDFLLASPLANDSIKCEAQLQKAGIIFELGKGEGHGFPRPVVTWDTVRIELAKVYDLYPNGPRAYHSRAKVMEVELFDHEDRFAEEFSCISANLKNYPDMIADVMENHYNMARSYFRMGKYTEARNKFQWVLNTFDEKTSSDPLVKLVIGHCICGIGVCALNTGDKEGFIQKAKEVLLKYPNAPEAESLREHLIKLDAFSPPVVVKILPTLTTDMNLAKGGDHE